MRHLIIKNRTIKAHNRKELHCYDPKYYIVLSKIIPKKITVRMITRDNAHNKLYYKKERQHVEQLKYKLRLNAATARQKMIIAENNSNNFLNLFTPEGRIFSCQPLKVSKYWTYGCNPAARFGKKYNLARDKN